MSTKLPRNESQSYFATLVADVNAMKEYPVSEWQPQSEMDIGLWIDGEGRWYVGDDCIANTRIIAFFARLLLPVGDKYALYTPQVAYPVRVKDTPYYLVEFEVGKHRHYRGRTNVGEVLEFNRGDVRYVRHEASGVNTPVVDNAIGCPVRFSRSCSIEWALRLVSDGA